MNFHRIIILLILIASDHSLATLFSLGVVLDIEIGSLRIQYWNFKAGTLGVQNGYTYLVPVWYKKFLYWVYGPDTL